MCGIAGFFGRETTWRGDIETMCRRMRHRGPDAKGHWHDDEGRFTLGHVRLSILDITEAGSQPMHSHDNRYVIVLNGEIYNHKDLKKKLELKGQCVFRGHSDTEIFLEYIAVYGVEQALADSIGMFAFALYDRTERRLVLARDRMGEKPLYYGYVQGGLIFASELGGIEAVAKESLSLDRKALTLYFRHGYIPAPCTIYREIRKLSSGSMITGTFPYSKESFVEKKYWDIKEIAMQGTENLFTGSYEEAVEELRRLIFVSIERQMVADVPVGAFLSGGIDSGTVVSLMQSLSTRKVKTFSIGFDEPSYDEAVYSKEIAAHLGTDHLELYVRPKDVTEIIPRLSHIFSEPFADSSAIPTYLVSRLARENVTVSLSGDGGDELFAGYESYRSWPRLWKKINKFPIWLRRMAGKIMGNSYFYADRQRDAIARYMDATSPEDVYIRVENVGWDEAVVCDGGAPGYAYTIYPHGFLKSSIADNFMLLDMLLYLSDDILTKVDRSAMAVSLESRVPFLDRDIVRFAWSLPLSYKQDGTIGKKVLRDVLYQYVPKELMDRPKKGFAIPIMEWVREGRLREWAEALLSPEKIRQEGVLSPKVVQKTWENFKKYAWNANKIWAVLMFEEWLDGRRTRGA